MGSVQLRSAAYVERDEFGRFIKKIERGGDAFLSAMADTMEQKAKRYAPRRTGKLRASIRGLVSGNAVYIVSNVKYATHMEFGTRRHPIPGVTANFPWKGGYFVWNSPQYGPIGSGKPYENWDSSGATVNHPGTRGYFFFRRSYTEAMSEAPALLKKAYV